MQLVKITIAVIMFLLAAAGCAPHQTQPFIDFRRVEPKSVQSHAGTDIHQPIRFVVSPVLTHKETIGFYRMITDHISIQTGRPTELIQRQSNAEVNVLLANGGADIAILSTGTYLSRAETQEFEPLVIQQRSGAPYYYGYVIVPTESGIRTMNALQGLTFAFTDPLSFSGHLSIVNLLKEQGRTAEEFFGRYQYTYSHLKALRAVANHIVDGAAIDSLAYDYAKEKEPDLVTSIRIIHTTPPIGTGPVVVRANMPETQKELIKSIFLNMHYNADMRTALEGLMIERFVTPQAALYDYPRSVLKDMRVRP